MKQCYGSCIIMLYYIRKTNETKQKRMWEKLLLFWT